MTRAMPVASPVDFDRYGSYGVKSRAAADGGFQRSPYPFRGRITAISGSGFAAEPGRYHLYISWACPWAHRSAIVRALLGLEKVVSMSVVDPIRDGRGWRSTAYTIALDTFLTFSNLNGQVVGEYTLAG